MGPFGETGSFFNRFWNRSSTLTHSLIQRG
jgi:hypothetical protein